MQLFIHLFFDRACFYLLLIYLVIHWPICFSDLSLFSIHKANEGKGDKHADTFLRHTPPFNHFTSLKGQMGWTHLDTD